MSCSTMWWANWRVFEAPGGILRSHLNHHHHNHQNHHHHHQGWDGRGLQCNCQVIFFLSIFIRMICSCCITPIHLALKNTTHDAMTFIQQKAWSSLTRSALQVRKTFNFLASVVVETADTVHAGTHLSRLYMAMRTDDLSSTADIQKTLNLSSLSALRFQLHLL